MRKIVNHTRGAARIAGRAVAALLAGLAAASAGDPPRQEFFKYPLV